MRVSDIRKLPTHCEQAKIHESIFRGFQILQKVKDYLARGVPADVVLELVKEMESNDDSRF